MAEQEEHAFVKSLVNILSTQPITYADDYQQPPENSLKRVPVLPIEVPAPPERRQAEQTGSSSATISILFKSSKPPASYTLSVQPTDTISSIKAQLAAESTAPPAEAQRLLLKGKALADNKLLKEYSIKGGDTVNLMVKPGFDWDPRKSTAISPSPIPIPMDNETPPTLSPIPRPATHGRHHQRIPSVVLSPSPSNELFATPEKDIVLNLDPGSVPTSLPMETLSTYHATIVKPEFWERLHSLLKSEFSTDADALVAFEDFLRASKGSLTASEIARIRDQVGVVGMAGR